jgi:predicted small metal-binding protein
METPPNLRVRCADVGQPNCNWQATGRTEEEVMRQAEQHGREKHNLREWTDEMKNKVRSAIRRIAA